MFQRRSGTAQVSGHLYESKLLSLLYFRAIHDDRIAELQLASNVDDIGAFDDICFKATVDVEGLRKPVFVFIQAKHKENKNQTLPIDLITFYNSYLKIGQHFKPNNNNLLFSGKFEETECLFIIYTTATVATEFSNDKKVKSTFCSILNDLINTGGPATQPSNRKEDVDSLCLISMKDQITSLAELMVKFIMVPTHFQQMLNKAEYIMLRYHVILAQKVLIISEIQPYGKIPFRNASFRPEFFDTNEECLALFRDSLYKEIAKKTMTIDKAVKLTAKEILLSKDFKVPIAFGNKDITISDKSRIEYLTTIMTGLLDKNKSSKMVTIDASVEPGFLLLYGGIAGAIGNIFVLDDNTKLMKITDNVDELGTDARSLYENLKNKIKLMNDVRSEDDKIPNLSEYKFSFKGNQFPKLLLEVSEYEEHLAKDFLNKLLIYSNQADEKAVEVKLKEEIEENLEYSVYIKAKAEAMFLKYHNEIQAWWMLPQKAPYLNKNNQIFERATSYIIEDPLMTSISVPYIRKIKQYNYTFSEDAVRSLQLQHQHSSTIIVAKSSVLTIVKVLQHFNNKNHVVLDLEDIVNLPTKERNALRIELTHTNKEKVLILVCNKIQKSGIEKKTFENVAEAVRDKKTIIITNDSSVQILQTYFKTTDKIVHDERNSLIDMSKESQMSILNSARVRFQDIEVGLGHLVSV